jgi:hypothetical protein
MSIVVVCLELRTPFRPRDLALRVAGRGQPDGYVRETPPWERARAKAKAFMMSYPKAAYMGEVERWRELPGAPSNSPCAGREPLTDGRRRGKVGGRSRTGR